MICSRDLLSIISTGDDYVIDIYVSITIKIAVANVLWVPCTYAI